MVPSLRRSAFIVPPLHRPARSQRHSLRRRRPARSQRRPCAAVALRVRRAVPAAVALRSRSGVPAPPSTCAFATPSLRRRRPAPRGIAKRRSAAARPHSPPSPALAHCAHCARCRTPSRSQQRRSSTI
jgi:hypothetical protein